jgi:cation diffusion facilitator family transporter
MGTHAVALLITLAAYIFARKHINNQTYSFGTGKVGVLAGYTNAILLLMAGGAMIIESVKRLVHPVDILFNEAIAVAVAGLVVNIVSAFILGHGSNHDHGPGHSHGHGVRDHTDRRGPGHHHPEHGRSHKHEDHNLKAAYLHVLTDALTSVLAIIALIFAKYYGIVRADPAVGILGACVVIRWAVKLLKPTANLLLDKGEFSKDINHLKEHLESNTTHVCDIHIWQLSENERSLIISLETSDPREPKHYHGVIDHIGCFDHITVEVNKKSA